MASPRHWLYKELLPFAAMLMVEFIMVGGNIMFKAASLKGISQYVFTVYAYAIATLVLSPFAFFSYRRSMVPPISTTIILRICLLALLGVSCISCVYKGLEYSSPTLSSAIGNLTPAFTFILAILLRTETLDIRSYSSIAQIIGTIIAIVGALTVVLFKGSAVSLHSALQSESTTSLKWIIGGLLFAIANLLLSFFYIIQSQTVKAYPAEAVVVFLLSLFATIISAPISFIMERNLSSWRITDSTELTAIIYGGCLGSCFCTVVHAWTLGLKGPVYVALFEPLSIAIAAIMGIVFLGETLYLGSVLGAVIIIIGFYIAMWGKMKKEIISKEMEGQIPETLCQDQAHDSADMEGKQPTTHTSEQVDRREMPSCQGIEIRE